MVKGTRYSVSGNTLSVRKLLMEYKMVCSVSLNSNSVFVVVKKVVDGDTNAGSGETNENGTHENSRIANKNYLPIPPPTLERALPTL